MVQKGATNHDDVKCTLSYGAGVVMPLEAEIRCLKYMQH